MFLVLVFFLHICYTCDCRNHIFYSPSLSIPIQLHVNLLCRKRHTLRRKTISWRMANTIGVLLLMLISVLQHFWNAYLWVQRMVTNIKCHTDVDGRKADHFFCIFPISVWPLCDMLLWFSTIYFLRELPSVQMSCYTTSRNYGVLHTYVLCPLLSIPLLHGLRISTYTL